MFSAKSITQIPKLSILIPAYNAELTLAECLRSCLEQTVLPHEILVGDDGSSDNTYEIARSFAPVVRVERHENVGQAATLNRLAEIATGDYLVLLDADDWNAPNRLEQIGNMIAHSRSLIVTHDAWHIFPDGSKVRHYELVRWHAEQQLHHLAHGNFVFGNPAIARSLWEGLGGFAAEVLLGEDYDFWLRALASGETITLLPEPVYFYRCHDRSKTSDQSAMKGLEETILHQRLADGCLTGKPKKVVLRALKRRTSSTTVAWRHLDEARRSGTLPQRRDLARVALHPRTTLRPRLKASASLVLRSSWLANVNGTSSESSTPSTETSRNSRRAAP